MITSYEAGGLGGHRVFDPQNLNYMIKDKLDTDPSMSLAVTAVVRMGTIAAAVEADPKGKVMELGTIANGEHGYKYHFDSAYWGDQGNTSQCTAFCAVHMVADGPVTSRQNPFMPQADLYALIQGEDQKMGNNFSDGATSLAMAKALKNLGRISGYLWGYSLDELVQATLKAPVLLGIDWYTGMDSPDKKHGTVRAQGRIRGGHEILVNGVDVPNGMFRLKNSWGRTWGKKGHCYLPFEDAEKLIVSGGDVCMAMEMKIAA